MPNELKKKLQALISGKKISSPSINLPAIIPRKEKKASQPKQKAKSSQHSKNSLPLTIKKKKSPVSCRPDVKKAKIKNQPLSRVKGLPRLSGKRLRWLNLYLNDQDMKTFFNGAECTRRSYNFKQNPQKPDNIENKVRAMTSQNMRKLAPYIEKWMEEHGLTENKIKAKICQLMDAKETRFFSFQGEVTETREVEALDIQAKVVNLAADVMGLKKNVIAPVKVQFFMDFGRPPPVPVSGD